MPPLCRVRLLIGDEHAHSFCRCVHGDSTSGACAVRLRARKYPSKSQTLKNKFMHARWCILPAKRPLKEITDNSQPADCSVWKDRSSWRYGSLILRFHFRPKVDRFLGNTVEYRFSNLLGKLNLVQKMGSSQNRGLGGGGGNLTEANARGTKGNFWFEKWGVPKIGGWGGGGKSN